MIKPVRALTEQWIAAFGEPPVLADAELMARVLAEYRDRGTSMTDEGMHVGAAPVLRTP